MNFLFYVIFFYNNVACDDLNNNELQVSLALMEELEIRQCVLLGFENNPTFISKRFSMANIQTTHLDYSRFIDYIENSEIGYFHTGVILKDKDLMILKQISEMFKEKKETYQWQKFKWLAFVENLFETNELSIPFDCEFILIEPINNTTYKITEIYAVKNTSFSLEFGTWNVNGLTSPRLGFYKRRTNFKRVEIKIVSSNEADHRIFTIIKEIIRGFADKTNLTKNWQLSRSLDDAATNFLENGDLFGNPLLFRIQQANVDFIGPAVKMIVNWYIKYPNEELRSDYYLLPFDITIWFILLIATILGTSLTLLSHRFVRNEKRSLIDDLFLGFETFLNQCGNEDIEGVYLKLKCVLLRFTAIVSIGLYGAIITSYFAVETFRAPFTNLDEFMSKGEYKILLNSTLDLALLVHVKSYGANTREVYKNVTKFIEVNYFYELVEKICYGKYAITFEENDIHYYTPPCKYYKIPQYFGVYWYGLFAKKNSFFTRIFNKNLIRFHENGMQRRWKKTIVDNTASSNEIAGDSFEPIDLEMMIQVLAIPLVGIALSTGLIVAEIVYEYFRFRKINQLKIFNG